MGTDKRMRQKENRRLRRDTIDRMKKRRRIRRIVSRIAAVVIVVVGAAALLARPWESSDAATPGGAAIEATTDGATAAGDTTVPATTTTTIAGRTITGKTPCPATDGTEVRAGAFEQAPPSCTDRGASYTAIVTTNLGEYTIELDADAAPRTVNNFVVLARYGYFDGTSCHRAIPGFMVQCGDPTGTGAGGPGYEFDDELPKAGAYEIGSVAMANAGPDTNGSQFFVVTGEAGVSLPPSYTLFGRVTDGLDTTIPALDAAGNPAPESNGVPPLRPIVIQSVRIVEGP
jgi:cyclophilin family peptidyl-prolyl cis-trans isomerase